MNKTNEMILKLDEKLCLKVNGLAGKRVVDKISYYVSRLGDGSIYFITLAIFIMFFNKPAVIMCKHYLGAGFINIFFYKIIKNKVKRKRPFTKLEAINKIMPPPDEFSFPSGHSGAAAVFFICTLHHMSLLLAMVVLVWMIMVGISRVYNGVHYPGDVLAGYAMGATVAKAIIFLV